MMNTAHPLVSVVITTKNESRNIRNCLDSIRAQTYSPIEIIVVDNQSTDDTKSIAREYTDKVYDKGPERSAQRNYGLLEKSSGDWVMYLDADMICAPELIAECVRAIQPPIIALHIPEIILGSRFLSKARRFERTFYDGTSIDGARFFSKKALQTIGGFDGTLCGPEDWDLDKRLKQLGSIGCLPRTERMAMPLAPAAKDSAQEGRWNSRLAKLIEASSITPQNWATVLFHNESEIEISSYLAKKSYYIQTFDAYIQKWGANDPDIKRQFGLVYRFFTVFLEKGKWRQLFSHPILAGGMYFMRFMVGVQLLRSRHATQAANRQANDSVYRPAKKTEGQDQT